MQLYFFSPLYFSFPLNLAILYIDIQRHVKLGVNNGQENSETYGKDQHGPLKPILLVEHETNAISNQGNDASNSLVGTQVLLPPQRPAES